MDVAVRVAARLAAGDPGLRAEGLGVRCPDGRLFPVEAAVSAFRGDEAAAARDLYMAVAAPQLACFLDGCDTSIVLFGQAATGKTYTLLGPGPDSIYDDQNFGIIPRFLRDAFDTLDRMPERNRVVHLTWMRLLNGGVTDLLGCGLAKCNSLIEALHYLAKGSADACYEPCHTVFTISIEQKWIGPGGILFHRLSTASFCELSSYPEPSLLSLEELIRELLQNANQKPVDYEKSLLTAMLRDSFGGRAFTWIVCCLDSDPIRTSEMIKVLELCWCCRGIRNYVTVNGFADNNTPLNVEKNTNKTEQYFGLQFAAQQWIKLVSNAEGLFHKILQSNMLSKAEIAQINEWMFLKAECDECLNPSAIGNAEVEDSDVSKTKNALPRITEDTEPSEPSDSDVDSDASLQHDDFLFSDKLCKYMEYFREKTDELTYDRCEEFLHCGGTGDLETTDTCVSESSVQMGRRKTIQPGESLTGDELELLRKAAANAVSPESQKIIVESHKASEDPEPKLVQRELMKMIDSPVPSEACKKYRSLLEKYTIKQNLISKLIKNIQDSEVQLKELVSLCVAKEQLIQDLAKIVKRQNNVKLCIEKESNLNEELKKARLDLINAQAKLKSDNKNSKLNQHVLRCKSLVEYYEKCSMDRELGKRLDCDNNKEIKKHENKLKAYRKQIEQAKKQIKRDEKRKNTLELEIIKDKSKLDDIQKQESSLVVVPKGKDKKQHSLKQVSVRISHLDHILKEKTSDLQKCGLSEDKESMLRREIRNLRKTRECLVDQRCILGQKRKIQRSLSDTEERKLLEYEEAIEAIDTAIEYKNELICGRGQLLVNSGGQRGERGEELLMARLSKLSNNEMRTLLYKYFQKVIDLRTTCVALEAATGAAQQEAGGWRRRCGDAWAALQHARLAHARRTTTLTARHYHTLNQLMNEIAGDVDSDSSSMPNGSNNRMPLQLEYPRQLNNRIVESDIENIMTHHSRIASTTAKIKVRDNVVQGDARILNKIQEVARYHQSGIPSQNLKQLQNINSDPMTKVTRQKNKLVIQVNPNK